jgi:DNA segregation ATPase FtsK/SpoIIIE-like protein
MKSTNPNYKELFRAACYIITKEQCCSKSQIQRRLNLGYNDATYIFNLLRDNNLIVGNTNYIPIFKDINSLEKLLDKMYYKQQ